MASVLTTSTIAGSVAVFVALLGLIVLLRKLVKLYRRERIPNFHEKRVFITGTDTGFGRELTLALDKKGLVVYAGCYTEHGGDELRKVASDKLRVLNIDVTKRETLEKARDFIEKDLPPGEGLWGLVNNAGIIRGILFDFCSVDDYRSTLEVNFFGTITTTEIFAPLIKKAKGRIVNVSSIAGRIPALMGEPYSCSKWALEPYCDGLRRSMKTFGVHVATIEPGVHGTGITSQPFLVNELERTWNRLPNNLKQEYGEGFKDSSKTTITLSTASVHTVLRHFNKLENVAKTMCHALSSKRPKARYICGLDANIMLRTLPFLPDWFLDLACRFVWQYPTVPSNISNASKLQ